MKRPYRKLILNELIRNKIEFEWRYPYGYISLLPEVMLLNGIQQRLPSYEVSNNSLFPPPQKKIQAISSTVGFPPELDGKNVLLK